MIRRLLLASAVVLAATVPSARAAIPTSLSAGCSVKNPAPGYSFNFCDDGVPGQSGITPNIDGKAITVPAKYDGHVGLPPRAADATSVPGSDPNGDIALDVDISYPTAAPPDTGYPVIAIMHGCCSGSKGDWESTTLDPTAGSGLSFAAERWHYNNAWFATRGYVVINYTARGFHAGPSGSTGETQLDSRNYEINDFQSLVGQLVDSNPLRDADPNFKVDPSKVVATGGSYGGGFAWLAMTDPKWDSPVDGTDIKLAAVAPRYGWTDLINSLIPNGAQSSSPASLPAFDGSTNQNPIGMAKKGTLNILYTLGLTGATFHPSFNQDKACLDIADPIETEPLCASTLARVNDFINDRSAYYQNQFFASIAGDSSYRIPAFVYAPWTDPLFTPIENLRMYNRLLAAVPKYPIKVVLGASTPHFAQNKTKEWADICGDDRHPCVMSDYKGGDLDAKPKKLKRTGITTQLNDFIDYYTRPVKNPKPRKPRFDVTASLETCPDNATVKFPADEPGKRYKAKTYGKLTKNSLNVTFSGSQTTTNQVTPNVHATQSDALGRFGACVKHTVPAEPGVAVYTTGALTKPTTMIGLPKITIDYSASSATNLQLNTRLYDVLPNGDQLMVDRGPRRVVAASGQVSYELHGNGWLFAPGHKIRVEIAQDDDPFVKASDLPSTTTISNVSLTMPVKQKRSPLAGHAGP